MKIKKTVYFVFTALFILSGAVRAFAENAPPLSAKPSPIVRVLVADEKRSMNITVKGGYRLWALPSGQLLKKGKDLSAAPLSPTPSGLRLGKEEWQIKALRIEPLEDRDLYINQSRFRGVIDVQKNKNALLYAINRLNVESYLYGVMHHEVAHWWPMEALKAQAIAARTYALYQVEVSKFVEYDLKSSTSSQVYGGSTTEKFRAKRAVDLTKGEVLKYEGKVFPAYFHATCAGLTAGAQELWKINIPPLAGGVQCKYCRLSPHFEWNAKVPLSEIEEKLKAYGRPIGQILKIEIITQTPSGRVGSVRITGTAGDFVMAAKDFRVWVGGDRMRSTLFSVSIKEDNAEFTGRGWGHGVGLCQWGTLGQAILGHTHEAILQFYYPSSELVQYAS